MHETQEFFPVGSFIFRRYIVVELLGQDESGAVYLVRDKRNQLNRFVLNEVIYGDHKERYGLLPDSKLLKRLRHPALPCIYQIFYGDRHVRLYILMDYIEGCNLVEVQRQQPEKQATLSQAINLISPMIEAVSYLHQQQPPLNHGNIKPSNIIISKVSRTPVLVAMGGIKVYSSVTSTHAPHQETLNYRAPEQYGGG